MSCRFISRWQQSSKIWVTADFLSCWAMIIAQILLHDRMIGASADHVLVEVVTVYLWMLIQVSPPLTLRICFQVNYKKSILVVWMQLLWLWLSQLGVTLRAMVAFSGLWYVAYDDYFKGLYIVSNCSWWQKSSAWLCRNQSRCLTDINLDECTSWSLLRVCRRAAWVTSPPQRASCGSGLWGALQLVSMCTTWFLAEWTDSCWQEKASSCLQNSWWGSRKLRSEHKKAIKARMLAVQISDTPAFIQL